MTGVQASVIVVSADHPSLAGHFPGQPVVPAVVLLNEIVATIEPRGAFALRTIVSAKFLQPVLPGERVDLEIRLASLEALQVRASFKGTRQGSTIFEGALILARRESR